MLLFTKFMIIKFSGMVDRRNINFHPLELSLGLCPRENSLGWKFMFLRSTNPENFIFLGGKNYAHPQEKSSTPLWFDPCIHMVFPQDLVRHATTTATSTTTCGDSSELVSTRDQCQRCRNVMSYTSSGCGGPFSGTLGQFLVEF